MKRKRIAALLLALCLLLACVPAATAAESEIIASGEEETYAWKLTADGVLTISGTSMPHWTNYEDQRPWADSIESIRKVVIEDGMTDIGDSAFQWCSNLTEVTIPESVTRIGYCAFYRCGLTGTLTLSENLVDIGECAFGDNPNLTAIEVATGNPEYCSVEGSLYSKDLSWLYTVPAGIVGDVVIPEGVEAIWYPFAGCGKITSITLPSSLVQFSEDCSDCYSLSMFKVAEGNSTFCAVDGILYNMDEAKMKCVPYAVAGTVTIPKGVILINHNICRPENLTAIKVEEGNPAFSSVDGILYNKEQTEMIAVPGGIAGSVVIPRGVTSIDGGISYRENLTAIKVEEGNPAFSSVDGILYNKEQTSVIAVPRGITGSVTIPNGVTSIDGWAFSFCPGMNKITIPKSVISIGGAAFFPSLKSGEVIFLGDRPNFDNYIDDCEWCVFDDTTTVYYPAGNATWEQGAERNAELGGRQPWQPYGGYNVIDGANGEWTEGSEALTVRADGALEKCTGVCVDGGVIDPANYDLESGSTIVKLHADYLKTLAKGEHILRILFSDGTAETKFTVKDAPSTDPTEPAPTEAEPTTPVDPDNPQTADTFTLLPAVLFAVSALGIALIAKKRALLR